MAEKVGSIYYDLDLDDKKFKRGLDQAAKEAKSFGSRLKDAEAGSKAFAAGLATIGAGLTGVAAAAVKSAGDFEQNRIAFETMLGSAERAKELLKEVSDFAAKTPFELPEVVTGAKQLLAYNIEAEKLIPTFNALGNIAAGVGRDKLPNLILAFGQVKAATKLTGMELRQFTEAGVPLLDMLAKQSGKTAAQIKEDMEAGMAPSFEEVEKALFSLSGEGGKFFNLMERQSRTFQGVMSNISDEVGRLARDIVGISATGDIRENSLFSQLTNAAKTLLDFVSTNGPLIKQGINDIFNALKDNIPIVVGIILGGLTPALAAAAAGVWALIAPLAPFIAAGAAVGFAVKMIIDRMGGLGEITKSLQPVFENIGIIWKELIIPNLQVIWNQIQNQLIPAYREWFNVVSPIMVPALKLLAFVLGSVVVVALLAVTGALQVLISVFTTVVKTVKYVAEKVIGYFTWIYDVLVGNSIIPDLINGISDWFAKLPGMITAGLSGLYNAITQPFRRAFDQIKQWANEVWESLQKINPFHRESPSLVDNVMRGMDVIKKEFSSLGDINIPTARMLVTPEIPESSATSNNITIHIDKVSDMQDVHALGRELGFRVGITPSFSGKL